MKSERSRLLSKDVSARSLSETPSTTLAGPTPGLSDGLSPGFSDDGTPFAALTPAPALTPGPGVGAEDSRVLGTPVPAPPALVPPGAGPSAAGRAPSKRGTRVSYSDSIGAGLTGGEQQNGRAAAGVQLRAQQ